MAAFERSDMEALRRQLAARRAQLADEVREVGARDTTESFRALTGEVSDSGDEAAANSLIDSNHAAVDRDLGEIHAIDAALARIEDGSYGRCIDCAEPIAKARLTAFPAALRCLSCQARYEHAHPGGEL
jgi:DnaK suppressor protein